MAGRSALYLDNKVLNYVFNGEAFTLGASLFLRLTSTVPTKAAAGTELTGGGYAAKAVTRSVGNFATATNGSITNAVQVDHFTATADLPNIRGAELWDAATGGNRLYYDDTLNKPVTSGDPIYFPVGSMVLTQT